MENQERRAGVTIAEGKSRGKNKLAGEILIARRRIAIAIKIGWPALEESWRLTLEDLIREQSEIRPIDISV
jgi:hypothetical protein